MGTITLSFEDKGKYITLLSIMHQQGRLPLETIRLLVGEFPQALQSKFKKDESGLFFNERLDVEVLKRNSYVQSRRDIGILGGRPKKEKINHKDNHKGNHKGNLSVNVNKDVIIIEDIIENDKFPFCDFWEIYAKKKDTHKCEQKWKQLTDSEKEEIIKRLPDYILSTPDLKYRKNPLSFLNGKCWLDDFTIIPEKPKKEKSYAQKIMDGEIL